MKLVMTLLVRNEQDIIRENIEFHLGQGVDFFIATDNRSDDTTTSILREYEERGLLHYIYEGNDDYNQHAWVTRMARMAYAEYGADWVINNDADEFWCAIKGNLREVFNGLPEEVTVVYSDRYNFVPVDGDLSAPFWSRMFYRERKTCNMFGRLLKPKVAHRGNANVIVKQGNHLVSGMDIDRWVDGLIEIMHFPIRDYKQIENKIVHGGAAYSRNCELPETVGMAWRKLYNDYQVQGDLKEFFGDQFHDALRLKERLEAGEICKDTKFRDHFCKTANYPGTGSARNLNQNLCAE